MKNHMFEINVSVLILKYCISTNIYNMDLIVKSQYKDIAVSVVKSTFHESKSKLLLIPGILDHVTY